MNKKITAFVPCRSGSERVPNKNTRAFAGEPDGLVGVKLHQLGGCDEIDSIILSTNDEKVIEIGERFALRYPKIRIDVRPEHLCTSQTSTDDLIQYAGTLLEEGTLLWTHVTSPMVDVVEYRSIVNAYNTIIHNGIHDSLMTVTKCQTFVWNDNQPVNYDRAVEKWPRTQTLEPLYLVNSAAFLIDAQLLKKLNDRVGKKPFLYVMDEIKSYEVDWEDQFKIAQSIYGIERLKELTYI